MLADIHLSEEEKFSVLLAAFVLFLAALLVALCLAITCCPLNKWLLERDECKRKRQQELAARRHRELIYGHQVTSQRSYYTNYHHNLHRHQLSITTTGRHYYETNGANGNKCAAPRLASYIGPPPAYEAALRATRLQSLTATSLAFSPPEPAPNDADSPDWLKTALTNQTVELANERPLDLGDYFHSPKEAPFGGPDLNNTQPARQQHYLAVPMQQPSGWPTTRPAGSTRPPVMLRLWVKLLEPDELVRRAREQAASAKSAALERPRMSLTRQLSIPHLFGSLMTLAGARGSISGPSGAGATATADNCDKVDEEARAGGAQSEPADAQHQQPSSLSSTASSAASSTTSDGGQQTTAAARPAAGRLPAVLQPDGQQQQRAGAAADWRRRGSLPAVRSITSRVLHMNVASFSYVKDESLISTKKHNQLNFHHFYAPASSTRQQDNTTEATTTTTTTTADEAKSKRDSNNKMCQLLVSICDIENLLGSSCLDERACLRLAQNSSIYIKCEILAAKSSAAKSAASRLLRNPLKVLTQQESSASADGTHTIDFAPTIPATVIETTPAVARAKSPVRVEMAAAAADQDGAAAADQDRPPAAAGERQSRRGGARVNWRHEPAADGKSIVVFNSIPKQVAQQQHLASSAISSQTGTHSNSMVSVAPQSLEGQQHSNDLIQFDSVFVSPILSKSLIESGHIRLRVYAQCKYVNETCLAELKLPLKQLMRAQTRDNLGDVVGVAAPATTLPNNNPNTTINTNNHYQQPQHQADFILNNLLANLVTASTGSPLSTLIEQISAEEREAQDEDSRQLTAGRHNDNQKRVSDHFRLTGWLTSGGGGTAPADSQTLQRCSSSPGPVLAMGAGQTAAGGRQPRGRSDEQVAARRAELEAGGEGPAELEGAWPLDAADNENCTKLIEQNYGRSLLVSHWLNYLVAPSYECQLVDEERGKLVLGLTYLPTSNRLVFNAHRASIEPTTSQLLSPDHKQLVKRLRMHSDTLYLVRFMMVANNRILKRKQTACSRKPEWDSQEPVTFDLVNVSVDQPSFVVALVMRNPYLMATAAAGGAGGSLQSLASYHQLRPCETSAARLEAGDAPPYNHHHHQQRRGSQQRACVGPNGPQAPPAATCHSDPESLRLGHGASCRSGFELARHDEGLGGGGGFRPAKAKRDLVLGHLVLAESLWAELKAQPRKQLVKQFRLL
jgi:hypothetical protein